MVADRCWSWPRMGIEGLAISHPGLHDHDRARRSTRRRWSPARMLGGPAMKPIWPQPLPAMLPDLDRPTPLPRIKGSGRPSVISTGHVSACSHGTARQRDRRSMPRERSAPSQTCSRSKRSATSWTRAASDSSTRCSSMAGRRRTPCSCISVMTSRGAQDGWVIRSSSSDCAKPPNTMVLGSK
jgi:hypothetical protein